MRSLATQRGGRQILNGGLHVSETALPGCGCCTLSSCEFWRDHFETDKSADYTLSGDVTLVTADSWLLFGETGGRITLDVTPPTSDGFQVRTFAGGEFFSTQYLHRIRINSTWTIEYDGLDIRIIGDETFTVPQRGGLVVVCYEQIASKGITRFIVDNNVFNTSSHVQPDGYYLEASSTGGKSVLDLWEITATAEGKTGTNCSPCPLPGCRGFCTDPNDFPENNLYLTIEGYENGTCGSCTALNGTFPLSYPHPLTTTGICTWQATIPTGCVWPQYPTGTVTPAVEFTEALRGGICGESSAGLKVCGLPNFVDDNWVWQLAKNSVNCSDFFLRATRDTFPSECGGTVTVTVHTGATPPAAGSVGAMAAPPNSDDCTPEMRRGKPVIPKGKRKG